MKNISFIGRRQELALIKKLQSKNFLLVVKGRRRIGKTTLLTKAFPDAAYIFIWPNKSPRWMIERICADHKLPTFNTFTDILSCLLDQKKVIIIDEFQNFLQVDSSVYGEIQKLIDERKINKTFLKLAVSGSSYSLIQKVLSDVASPLYGRRDAEITLSHLPIPALFQELQMPLREFIELWSVFEGIPYYYELIDTTLTAQENIQHLILAKNASLQNEGKTLLAVEFGKDSKTYSTIFSAIAEGKTKLQEISSLFDGKSNEVIKYLDLLRNEFKLVQRATPLLADPRKSKEGHYLIIDNFLHFWFHFIDKQRDYIEQERFKEVQNFFNANFNAFVGRKFEKFILQLLNSGIITLRNEDKMGSQWGSIPGASKDKNQYEIDICAINEKKKELLLGECKWEERVDARMIIAELQQKASYLPWHQFDRKEYYALFAKSFKTKISKEGVYLYDLQDIKRALHRP